MDVPLVGQVDECNTASSAIVFSIPSCSASFVDWSPNGLISKTRQCEHSGVPHWHPQRKCLCVTLWRHSDTEPHKI